MMKKKIVLSTKKKTVVPDDAHEGENLFVQILNQGVDNHFAFYLL
jgi:hypothetical protein